ncbi:MAG: peptidase M48, partial [Luminiphilus sp.]|nr:peptidase M48 [Luminiphilus sp.]
MALKRLRRIAILSLIGLFWTGGVSGASTVTIGGKSVELPDDIAEEHQKLVDNIGIYDDPELDA